MFFIDDIIIGCSYLLISHTNNYRLFPGQAVLSAAKKKAWPENEAALNELAQLFTNVTEYMKSIM